MTVNNENRHIIYDIVNDYFSQWLNNSDGLTEIAVNRPGELFTINKREVEKRTNKYELSRLSVFCFCYSRLS